jgi:hypothetical protein
MKRSSNKITEIGTRARTMEKSLIFPTVQVNPYNPWQSVYRQDYNKQMKRSRSMANKKESKVREAKKSNFKIKTKTKLDNTQSMRYSLSKPEFNQSAIQKEKIDSREFEIPSNKLNRSLKDRNYHDKKLDSIVNENTAYFAHLVGKCLCGTCSCGHCKCDHPKALNLNIQQHNKDSTYTHDYVTYKNCNKRKLKRQHTEQLRNPEQFHGNSTYKADYVPLDPNTINKSQKVEFVRNEGIDDCMDKLRAPFPLSSVYTKNFLNWKDSVKVLRFGKDISQSHIKLPFHGKSSNQVYGNFGPGDLLEQVNKENFGKPQFKNPLGPSIMIKKQSASRNAFKPLNGVQKPKKYSDNKERELKVNANGHFKTSSEALNGQRPSPCPSKQIVMAANKQLLSQSLRKYSQLLNQGAQ